MKPQAVSRAAVGWACLGFGGTFILTGGLVFQMFFIGGRGPPLQAFRLDHPVLPVIVPLIVIGVVLFIVGLRLRRGERAAERDEQSVRARARAWRGAWGALAVMAAFYGLLWTAGELKARARAEDLRRELAAAGYTDVRIVRLGAFSGRCGGRGWVPFRWVATQGGGYACGHWFYPLDIEVEPGW